MSSFRSGAHERHLLRQKNNLLFPAVQRQVDEAALMLAREQDLREREAFSERFRGLLEEAAGLKASEESETLLRLKARLDDAYTLVASLGGDNAVFKQGLRRLTETLMVAIRRSAGSDPTALAELEQERLAREEHYRLLEYPLAADLMRPGSPIRPDELVATLLSSTRQELAVVVWLFGPGEWAAICREAEALLARESTEQGWGNLQYMQTQCIFPE
ncbi:MAG: hypothetical protein AB1450_06435 [Pseudomonadota bacterium]